MFAPNQPHCQVSVIFPNDARSRSHVTSCIPATGVLGLSVQTVPVSGCGPTALRRALLRRRRFFGVLPDAQRVYSLLEPGNEIGMQPDSVLARKARVIIYVIDTEKL